MPRRVRCGAEHAEPAGHRGETLQRPEAPSIGIAGDEGECVHRMRLRSVDGSGGGASPMTSRTFFATMIVSRQKGTSRRAVPLVSDDSLPLARTLQGASL